jgi:hypothetical protein
VLTVDRDDFISSGFTVLRHAVPRTVAAECADVVWRSLGVEPHDPGTWPGPVAHAQPTGPSFHLAASASAVASAVDQLVGAGRWQPRVSNIGNCVARFPTGEDSKDTGWHIDASYHPDDLPWPSADGQPWRVNVHSRGRGALLLYLLTDITADDAPTRVRVGSHLDVARLLAGSGAAGIPVPELDAVDAVSVSCPVLDLTGEAGDVVVCHPFLVHAAQVHRGSSPRLIAQPGVLLREPYALTDRSSSAPPVEAAILAALDGALRNGGR